MHHARLSILLSAVLAAASVSAPLHAHSAAAAVMSARSSYASSGWTWPAPQHLTISFLPDGVSLQEPVLQATNQSLDAHLTLAHLKWDEHILKAAQVWAEQANINVAAVRGVLPDATPDQIDRQGDPRFGDIRLGGHGYDHGTLRHAYSVVFALPQGVSREDAAFSGSRDFGLCYGVDDLRTEEATHIIARLCEQAERR